MTTSVSVVPTVTDSPRSRAALVAALRRVHAESVLYWTGYPAPEFFRRPAPEVWAPADQVRHLTKSMRGIITGFEMPRLLVALRFGAAFHATREYDVFRALYEDVLRRGARARGYAPRALDPAEQDEAGRARIMQYHAEAVERLCAALGRWPEWSLDRLRLRHPALGMLTTREMAMFALLHNVHHVHVAERRRGN